MEELRRERDVALERLAALAEILSTIRHAGTDVDAVLRVVVATAARLCHADSAYLLRDEDGVLRPGPFHGEIPEDERALFTNFPATPTESQSRDTLIGRVATTRHVVHVLDVRSDTDLGRIMRESSYAALALRYGTMLGVPLLREGAVLGMIELRRRVARPFDDQEIALVRTFADQAVIAIENADLLRTVQRQRAELSRFLSPQVADVITSKEGAKLLDGHRREITVVAVDMRGFTPFAESAEPEEVLGLLRAYHKVMGQLIVRYQGTLEHFEGDGMMVFFNDPVPLEHHELQAVRMAVAMREQFAELAQGWRRHGYELGFGVGAAVGHATLGRIGFEGRYDYAAVGNVVIQAFRLTSEAKAGQILISQRLHAAIESHVVVEAAGPIVLKGFAKPVMAQNVIGLK